MYPTSLQKTAAESEILAEKIRAVVQKTEMAQQKIETARQKSVEAVVHLRPAAILEILEHLLKAAQAGNTPIIAKF